MPQVRMKGGSNLLGNVLMVFAPLSRTTTSKSTSAGMESGSIMKRESECDISRAVSRYTLSIIAIIRRKREAREVHKHSAIAQKTIGLKAKMLNKKRRAEKIQMKKTIKQHEERDIKAASTSAQPDQALPTYLLDRENQKDAKALSSAVKERRKDKAARYSVPLPQVRGIAEDEAFKVMKSGKRKSKAWKRVVTKATFVGESFTRKPPKLERFIRPMGLRYKKAHITHPDLKATFQLPIIGVKKNPQSPMYTQLGVLTKGTIIEVNVSELGMVTTGGKVVWGKYAQITNNPVSAEAAEGQGCMC
jgi:ribosome biogenesis protein NSA2